VYLFDGDSHIYNSDQPLAAGSPWLITYGVQGAAENLQRVTVDGSSNNKDWLKGTVNRPGALRQRVSLHLLTTKSARRQQSDAHRDRPGRRRRVGVSAWPDTVVTDCPPSAADAGQRHLAASPARVQKGQQGASAVVGPVTDSTAA